MDDSLCPVHALEVHCSINPVRCYPKEKIDGRSANQAKTNEVPQQTPEANFQKELWCRPQGPPNPFLPTSGQAYGRYSRDYGSLQGRCPVRCKCRLEMRFDPESLHTIG